MQKILLLLSVLLVLSALPHVAGAQTILLSELIAAGPPNEILSGALRFSNFTHRLGASPVCLTSAGGTGEMETEQPPLDQLWE